MAYDRYENRNPRSPDYDRSDFRSGRRDERGFFERAGDEIASWFGDDDAERRRREDERMNRGRDYDRGYRRDFDRDRASFRGSSGEFGRNRWREEDRGRSQYPRSSQDWDRYGYSDYDRDFSPRGYGYSPPVQGYGPSYVGASGYTGGYGYNYGAGESYGSSGYGGSFGRGSDRHYQAWRQRQLDELDNDYDRYNRERQERFENDFGTWRQNRMGKRQRLGMIREHMDVVGSDGEMIGKVDCVRGDHIVLTKGDSPDHRHHKLDCSMIGTVEGDEVRLDIPAEEAKSRWEDEGDRDRGFFGRGERSDRDEETNLNRSFSGTYES